jgi:putative nucleotidyltransferase with HDIG domain
MEQLIIQIASAANVRTLYPANHPRVTEAVARIVSTLREVCEERGGDSVTLLIVGDDLVIEQEVLRRTTLHQRQLIEMLKRGGLERLTLADGLDLGEADRLVAALAAGDTPEASPHVVLGRVHVVMAEEGSSQEVFARRELSVDQLDVVREAFARFRSERRVPLAEMEQLVWSFIDSLSSTTRNMLPLAKLKEHDEYTFIHSVNVSLLVLAQARSFGIHGPMLHAIGMAALLHDIGKPATREIGPDGVSFHHHEVVGAKLARKRLRELKYPKQFVDDVCRLVELHLRFHTYRMGWTDAAVRRYVTDAGPLLDRLNKLVRSDCTTRNRAKAQRLAESYDSLEDRVTELAKAEELAAIRPDLDGREIMAILGIPPGPLVGQAYAYLLDQRMERGPIPHDEAVALLKEWAARAQP